MARCTNIPVTQELLSESNDPPRMPKGNEVIYR